MNPAATGAIRTGGRRRPWGGCTAHDDQLGFVERRTRQLTAASRRSPAGFRCRGTATRVDTGLRRAGEILWSAPAYCYEGTMDRVDVLVIAALPEEFDAARTAGLPGAPASPGVLRWEERDLDGLPPFLWGEYRVGGKVRFTVALARPTQMGGRATGSFATSLTDRLRPASLAMCGVCAGNPADTALGDVVVGEPVYEWDEGKQSASGFQGDHRQFRLEPRRLRAAQDVDPSGLAAYGDASDEQASLWFLEQVHCGRQPRDHPARDAYFPSGTWPRRLAQLAEQGLIRREPAGAAVLTSAGSDLVQRRLYDDADGPQRLPFRVLAAPMASGSAVVADPGIWRRLAAMGMRKVAAVDMEAATIATIAHERNLTWLVAKGVMDHADATKDDRYKEFAARASAQVMFALLEGLATRTDPGTRRIGGPVPHGSARPPRVSRRTVLTVAGLLAAATGGLGYARQRGPDEDAVETRADGCADWPPSWPTGRHQYGDQAYLPGGYYRITVDTPGYALRSRAPVTLETRGVRLAATAQVPAGTAGWGLWCGDADGAVRFELGVGPDGRGYIDVQGHRDTYQKDPPLGEPAPAFTAGADNHLEAECVADGADLLMTLKVNGTKAVERRQKGLVLGAITVGVYGALPSGGSVRSAQIRYCGFTLAKIG